MPARPPAFCAGCIGRHGVMCSAAHAWMEDPRSPRGRSKADQETFKFPIKEVGHLYVSANAPHTIEYRMPALVKKAIIIDGLGAVFLFGVWSVCWEVRV